jgi:hypothetical protein
MGKIRIRDKIEPFRDPVFSAARSRRLAGAVLAGRRGVKAGVVPFSGWGVRSMS